MRKYETKHANFTFTGAELGAVVGYPKHKLLLIASQVNEMAGVTLKDMVAIHAQCHPNGVMRVGDFNPALQGQLKGMNGKIQMRRNAWLFDEPTIYFLLLHGMRRNPSRP